MATYSIKDLEQLSGIKAHTIRIWEQRYELLNPERTDTNIRYYKDEDLKKLLNVSMLIKFGEKISKVSKLSEEEISERVLGVSSENIEDTLIDSLVTCMLDIDEARFVKTVEKGIAKLGIEEFFSNHVYPFLEKVGVLWQVGSVTPAQEHFISNLIRQKLITAIDQLGQVFNPEAKTYLLFLHEKEMHEIGLLFYSYILQSRGYNVVYLGQAVPYQDLLSVGKLKKVDALITCFVNGIDKGELEAYIKQLKQDFSSQTIYATGYQLHHNQISSGENFSVVSKYQEFVSEL